MGKMQRSNALKFEALFKRAGKDPLSDFSAAVLKSPHRYMDLHIDRLMRNEDGAISFSLAHYDGLNGRNSADPRVEVWYYPPDGDRPSHLVAQTYRNDLAGITINSGRGQLGKQEYLDEFLDLWLDNLLEQGHV